MKLHNVKARLKRRTADFERTVARGNPPITNGSLYHRPGSPKKPFPPKRRSS